LSEDKHKNKIDVDKIDLEKEREKTTENPGTLAFPHHVGSVVIKPEDEGKVKGRAVAAMREQTEHQLGQLKEQMQTIIKQANDIKHRVEISERIYLAQMSFEPMIGEVYYLYEKENGPDVLSMISPKEWRNKMPFSNFVAEVKLMSDHTWKVNFSNREKNQGDQK